MQQTKDSFAGTYTALVTPFTRFCEYVDGRRLREQMERQISGGIDGVVPVGTTGESPTLTVKEHVKVIKATVKLVQGRVKVLAGTGANSTQEAVELTRAAEKAGANGSLQVAPYYNKPTQEGLFAHFKKVAQATGLPIILYNIPGRCGIDIAVDTVCRLRETQPSIVGIKVANGSADYVTELHRKLGFDFALFSGDDSLTLPFMAVGAQGVISVVSNILPQVVSEMVRKALSGKFDEAQKIHFKLFGLTKSLFIDGNPAGVKYALELLSWDSGTLRLPLVRVRESTRALIRKELTAFGFFQ